MSKKEIQDKVYATAIEALYFVYKNGIINFPVGVTFNEDRQTSYAWQQGIININVDEIDAMYYLDEMIEITAKNDDAILGTFSAEEICFFHELGHAIDMHMQGYTKEEVQAIFESREEMELIARSKINQLELFEEVESDVVDKADEALHTVFYRNLPLELEADEIAYLLMRYAVENGGFNEE